MNVMTRWLGCPAAAVLGFALAVPANSVAQAATAPVTADSGTNAMGSWALTAPQLSTRAIAGAATSWAEQGVAGNINGIDVSMWNTAPDYPLLRLSGVQFAFIKASEFSISHGREGYPPSSYANKNIYADTKSAVVAAGIIPGSYQYAKPTSIVANVVADATLQAKVMVARVGVPGPNELPPVLDLEYNATSLNKTQMTLWAITWLNAVKGLIGRDPILYSYTNFMRTRLNADPALTAFPLWQADYNLHAPGVVLGWPTANRLFWQFSSSGLLPGHGIGPIDLNTFLGSPSQWAAIIGSGTRVPQKVTRSLATAKKSNLRLRSAARQVSINQNKPYRKLNSLSAKKLRNRGAQTSDLAYSTRFGFGGGHGPYAYLRTSFTGGAVCSRANSRKVGAPWFRVNCPRVSWRALR